MSTSPNINIANERNGLPKKLNSLKRSIRNLVSSEADLDEASKLINHADTSTTAKYYRLKPTVVTPLSSQKNYGNH